MTRTLSIVSVLAFGVVGCAAPRVGPYRPLDEASRDTREADRLNTEAAALMAKDPAGAERLLRDALTADLYHGAAHNNLGVIFLKQDQLYAAASEFEWAQKLMPGHPDPRMNLALTLEKAGRIDDALANYASALEVYPEHLPSMQGLARLQVRSRRTDNRTAGLLREIAMRGETPEWREWARVQVAKSGP